MKRTTKNLDYLVSVVVAAAAAAVAVAVVGILGALGLSYRKIVNSVIVAVGKWMAVFAKHIKCRLEDILSSCAEPDHHKRNQRTVFVAEVVTAVPGDGTDCWDFVDIVEDNLVVVAQASTLMYCSPKLISAILFHINQSFKKKQTYFY